MKQLGLEKVAKNSAKILPNLLILYPGSKQKQPGMKHNTGHANLSPYLSPWTENEFTLDVLKSKMKLAHLKSKQKLR